LLNFKSVVMTFVPDRTANTAQVYFEPPLAGVQMQTTVPLSPGNGANGANGGNGACGDYRATLKADFSDPTRIRFGGSYPPACLEKVWPVAYADPKTYNLRAVEGLWRAMGGQLGGTVRGAAPASTATLTPVFEMASPALAEVIRDINKFSNNVMAQQLFLSLSLPARPTNSAVNGTAASQASPAPASREASRAVVNRWWKDRISADDAPTIDNGSGLSRSERISAQALARMLQTAYRSPLMPELMSSLPIAGVDGTLRRSKAAAQGSAHLKTGSLRDVTALAGYVHGTSGKRYVLVAIANHANANAVRPAFDALVDWTVRD
jgi:D-alanyl-D-alanine carboxypeptidase/D-alanyl-D-alanine-endopeptidase (penicillin-binding protein 4)